MLYTIKCRRGHCGASHSGAVCEQTLTGDLFRLQERMRLVGWLDGPAGWLCPFDAPKPATKGPKQGHAKRMLCARFECMNLCDTTDPGELTAHGWHQTSRTVDKEAWYCPACWKTTQPEPIHAQAAAIMNPAPASDWSIDEIKEVAAEVAKAEIQAFVTSLSIYCAGIGGQYSAPALLEAMERTTTPEEPRAQPPVDDEHPF